MKVKTVIADNIAYIDERVNGEIEWIERHGGKVVNVSLAINPDMFLPIYAMIIYNGEVKE